MLQYHFSLRHTMRPLHIHWLFRVFPGLVLTAILAACSQPEDRFTLKGRMSGVQQGEFYIYSDDATFNGVDTIRINDGQFLYDRKLTVPTVLTLLYPNFSQTFIVAEPGTEINMAGDASKLGEADITGTEENELLTAFRQQHTADSDRERRMAAAAFIRDNRTTLAAVAIFKRYFASEEHPDAATTLPLLDELRKAQPQNAALSLLDHRLRPLLSATPGCEIPDFSLTDIKGKQLTKPDVSGKPLIVAFWATWTPESYPLLNTLQDLCRKYGERLAVIAVSLDTEEKKPRDRAEQDTLRYNIVCDGLAFNTPAVRQFGMRYVPSILLADAQGRIVARDIKAAELRKRLEEMLR